MDKKLKKLPWKCIILILHLHGHVDPRSADGVHDTQDNHPNLGERKC